MVDSYLNYISEKGFSLRATLETHFHADHISGSNKLASKVKNCKLLMGDLL